MSGVFQIFACSNVAGGDTGQGAPRLVSPPAVKI
jgi:hypothetical protein